MTQEPTAQDIERVTRAIEREVIRLQGEGRYIVTGYNDSVAFARAAIAALARPDTSETKLREALGWFMRAYDGIAADSFDGIEERYALMLQEGHARGRLALCEAALAEQAADPSCGHDPDCRIFITGKCNCAALSAAAQSAIKQAVLDEREACAKVAEDFVAKINNPLNSLAEEVCDYIASAIRARTEPSKGEAE